MRVLILGGDGMLGHRLLRHFSPGYETRVTLRRSLADYSRFCLFNRENAFDETDVREPERGAAHPPQHGLRFLGGEGKLHGYSPPAWDTMLDELASNILKGTG